MKILNSDTNATMAGWKLPEGVYELDLEGSLQIVTSGGITSNVVVGSRDTILIGASAVEVSEGVPIMLWMGLGFGLVFTLLFGLGFLKKVKSDLGGGRLEV